MRREIKYRAKLEILHYITAFCLKHTYHKAGLMSFEIENAFIDIDDTPPPIGSLVILTSAPATKWYLGWYKGIVPANKNLMKRYLIESIEDGHDGAWYNIGLAYLSPAITNKFPRWRWTDKQFYFDDRWKKANKKSENSYVFRLAVPEFKEDGSVVLGLMKRVTIDKDFVVKYSKILSEKEWKKATLKSLIDFVNINIKKEV